ncbi:hypothetical protein M514_05935 [Trichuris suis]|uniref:PNK FHA domain-containing protein n=1 Tax=Trichuris suis TaxID=68888 RepID=A0A085M7M9_9BILA|nr:hypothetical protein M513_05935 [Trichuris suis]KFD65564.1 hypothetical protein M514_05935 [Trichuris suis]KHJ40792.1 DNA 3'-phosphatase [Trichuris suis]
MLRSLHGENDVLPIKDTIVLGRNRLTKIKHMSCSRKQMEVAYDLPTDSYRVRHIGRHRSVVAGKLIAKGDVVTLKSGDILELLPGRCKFRFEPAKRTARMQTSLDFFTSCNTDLLKNRKWAKTNGLLVFTVGDVMPSNKIAGFDLDGTIINTMSGRVYPTDAADWTFAKGNVVSKLRQLPKDGYNVVIFTNQKGISSGRMPEEEFQSKLERIANVLCIPFVCYASTRDDFYRKPRLGMWERYCATENSNAQVNMEWSVFVGDAAGRRAELNRPKDHSCADRLFALNAGLRFQTPEEFFMGRPPETYKMPAFNPKALTIRPIEQLLEPTGSPLTTGKQEVIILVGVPGSGKSYFFTKYLKPHGFVHVSLDVLANSNRCIKYVEESLEQGNSVVIDNTNADRKSRATYVALAKKANVDCRCFVMNVTFEHARHNNAYRRILGTDKAHNTVTDVVMSTCKARFEEPTLSEGFSSIVRANFLPHFDDQRHQQIYQMYLLEQ